MIFMNSARDKNPLAKAAAQPAITGTAPIDELTSFKSLTSSKKAPNIAGILTMKENSPAMSLVTPQSSAPEIVEPLREIPAMVPIPCATPIKRACMFDGAVFWLQFSVFLSVLLRFSISEEKIRRNEVNKNPVQTYQSGRLSRNFSTIIPSSPVTNVARIIATIYCLSFGSVFFFVMTAQNVHSRLQIFLRKKSTTAQSVARCRNTSNKSGMSDNPKKYCAKARWPEEEIGRNSAMPCRIPSKIPCKIFISTSNCNFIAIRVNLQVRRKQKEICILVNQIYSDTDDVVLFMAMKILYIDDHSGLRESLLFILKKRDA